MYKAIGLSFQEITRLALDPKLKHSASYCVSDRFPIFLAFFIEIPAAPSNFSDFVGRKTNLLGEKLKAWLKI
jgi:hypothetical protein